MSIFGIMPITEVYFGKNKNLLEIEKCIGEIRKDMTRITIGNTYKNDNLIRINRLIEEEFGFKNVAVMIDTNHYYNAYTFPVSNALDTGKEWDKFIIKNNNGYKWKKEAEYSTIIVLFTGMLGDKRFTDGEITAILLHEIGHSFSNAMNDLNIGFSFIKKLIFIPSYILTIINALYNNQNELFEVVFSSAFLFNRFIGKLAQSLDRVVGRKSRSFDLYVKLRNMFSIISIPKAEFFYILSHFFIGINIFSIIGTNMEKHQITLHQCMVMDQSYHLL